MFGNQPRATLAPLLGACAVMLAACDGTGPLGPGAADDGLAPAATISSAHATPAAPVVATFEKWFMPDEGPETLLVWHGSVTLDGKTGDLESTIDLIEPGSRFAGQTLHATVRWVVTGDLEIEFETSGVVNLNNGIVRTNGHVVSGPYAGSRVHQQGQLVGMDASGFLRIAPATGA
jgi:hypothetical protein